MPVLGQLHGTDDGGRGGRTADGPSQTHPVLVTVPLPAGGIATDAAHSSKHGITEYQGIDIATGRRLFYRNLGNMTVNIGEFLAVVEAVRYIIEHDHQPRVIYTDSTTAISWFRSRRAASVRRCPELRKAEIFLKAFAWDVETIEVRHWDNRLWGEIPADFGNK